MKPIDLTEFWESNRKQNNFPKEMNLNPKTIDEIYQSLKLTYQNDGSILTDKEKLMLKSAIVGGVIVLINNLKANDKEAIDTVIQEINDFMNPELGPNL